MFYIKWFIFDCAIYNLFTSFYDNLNQLWLICPFTVPAWLRTEIYKQTTGANSHCHFYNHHFHCNCTDDIHSISNTRFNFNRYIFSVSVIILQIKTSLLLKRYRNQSRTVQSCFNSQVLVMAQIYTFCFIFFHGPMVSNAVLIRLNVLLKRLSIVTMLSSTAIVSKFEAITGPLLFICVNRPVRQLIQNSIMTVCNINQ